MALCAAFLRFMTAAGSASVAGRPGRGLPGYDDGCVVVVVAAVVSEGDEEEAVALESFRGRREGEDDS